MKDHLLLWTPRAVGLLVVLFLGMFALDAFAGQGILRAIPAFLIHLLPSFALLAIVLVAWRRPLVGAIAFSLLALLYAATTLRRPDWILVIAGPPLVAGMLYLASWLRFRARPLP